jgi:MFS superfamily sulfate permease-like transporter
MLEPVQNQTHLIELLERLCLAVENLTEDLRPELKKTATLERRKQEAKEIETAAAKAVAKWKDKKVTRSAQLNTDRAQKKKRTRQAVHTELSTNEVESSSRFALRALSIESKTSWKIILMKKTCSNISI